MILYIDTSALVKLYVAESGSEHVARWVEEAEDVMTSCVTYPEAMSALVRRRNDGTLTSTEFETARDKLEVEWTSYPQVVVDELTAGMLVIRHGLRGFDAIHIAAALNLLAELAPLTVAFSSFDTRQLAAARAEGLTVLEP